MVKKAFTPAVVRQIHESLMHIWPDLDDYKRVHHEGFKNVSGLYIGTYEPAAIFQAVTRHALYSEKIFLVDPFLHPGRIRNEFNPLLHPDQHRSNTIKFTFLWLTLLPWIEAGIVNFIRPPIDFVPGLHERTVQLTRKRYEASRELQGLVDEHADEQVEAGDGALAELAECCFLSHPNDWFSEMFKKAPPDKSAFPNVDVFLKYVQWRRDNHSYYVEMLPGQTSEVFYESSGANYELAKHICALTGSHIITDLKSRWKEIEVDRANAGVFLAGWTPFAKALQNSDLKVLNNVSLKAALTLRRENRLEGLRNFFHRVWKSCRDPDEFSNSNAENLTAELDGSLREAKAEWNKIDQELLRWFGAAGAALVSSGLVGFVPAASGAAITGAVGLAHAQLKRDSFKERFPEGFFLTIKS